MGRWMREEAKKEEVRRESNIELGRFFDKEINEFGRFGGVGG